MTGAWKEEASAKLAALSGLTVQDYCHCDFGRSTNPDCISVIVEETKGANPFQLVVDLLDGVFANTRAEKQAVELIKELKKQLAPGLYTFIGTKRWLGTFKPSGVEIVIGPGESQLDIVRHARTDAANYDLTTEDLVKKLSQYDKQFGIEITHAETDTIQFNMLTLPDDLPAFGQDLYAFCPDLIDQGCGSMDHLIHLIKQQKIISLWWD